MIGEATANPQKEVMANENEMNEVVEAVESVQANPVSEEPSNLISEGVTLDNDSSDDDVLERIMGGQESEEPALNSVPEQSVPGTQAVQSDPEPEAETRGQPGEDYHRAMVALQRDGTPREILDDLYEKSPEELVSWGLKREKVQKDGDRFSDEHAKLREQFDSFVKRQQGNAEGDSQSPEPQVDPSRWQNAQPPTPEVLEAYGKEIAEVFGDEAAETIMGPMRSMAVMLGHLLGSVSGQAGHTEQQELAKTRSDLQERFPHLKDEEGYGSVVEKMKVLYRTGEYKSLNDLMTDAARIVQADAPVVEANDHHARSLGQPTVRTSNARPAAALGTEDREDRVLDALFDGKGLDGAVKAYNT